MSASLPIVADLFTETTFEKLTQVKVMVDYGDQRQILAMLKELAKEDRHFLKKSGLPKCQQLHSYKPISPIRWTYNAGECQRGQRLLKYADCKKLPEQSNSSNSSAEELSKSKSKPLPSSSPLRSLFSPPVKSTSATTAKSTSPSLFGHGSSDRGAINNNFRLGDGKVVLAAPPTLSSELLSSSSPHFSSSSPQPPTGLLKTSKSSRGLSELAKVTHSNSLRNSAGLNDIFNDQEVLWKVMELISFGGPSKKKKQKTSTSTSASASSRFGHRSSSRPPLLSRPSAFDTLDRVRGTSRYAQTTESVESEQTYQSLQSEQVLQSDEEKAAAEAAFLASIEGLE